MSSTKVTQKNQNLLWALSAGRCQYEGCSKVLHTDILTKKQYNSAYIAHIVADAPNGPRGNIVRSKLLANNVCNLMLLCDEHHRLIDKEDVEGHTELRLLEMKRKHEGRIELLTSIAPNMQTEIILFAANIGEHNCPMSFNAACEALLYNYYPTNKNPIELGYKNSSLTDDMEAYWVAEVENLKSQVQQKIKDKIMLGNTDHYSVFALAPQPLLIKLGTLLNDIHHVRVFQKHREPQTWKWLQISTIKDYIFNQPSNNKGGTPVLVISLCGTIAHDRIEKVLGEGCSIWEITIDMPSNDFLKTEELLMKYRKTVRFAFDKIKACHGCVELHVFPAMPVSASIELGRAWMPKADMPLVIYDETKNKGGFYKTITIR